MKEQQSTKTQTPKEKKMNQISYRALVGEETTVAAMEKKHLQAVLRSARKEGYTVKKTSSISYRVLDGDDEVLTALKYSWGYSVIYKNGIFKGEGG